MITLGVLVIIYPKNDLHSDISTQWTLVILNFTVENYGINLICYQIDTPCPMFFKYYNNTFCILSTYIIIRITCICMKIIVSMYLLNG